MYLMALEEKLIIRTRSYSRLTVLAVVLLLAVGAVVIILNRQKFAELFRASNWSLLTGVVVFTAVSYFAGSYSFILIMRSCGCAVRSVRLFGIGLTSLVLLNLIGQRARLS